MILAHFSQEENLLIAIFIGIILIYFIWKFIKFIIYQISYTIGKAMNDSKKEKEIKEKELMKGE